MANKRICLIVSRIKAGLSQKELADKIGVTQQSVTKWEKGLTQPSSFRIMNELEAVLKSKKECMFPDIFNKGCECKCRAL